MLSRLSPHYVIVEQTGAGGQRNTMQPQLLEYILNSCSVLTVLGPNLS